MGVFQAGLGTDTGGSIRVPAAFCGVTGFRPTFGFIPVEGCVPLVFSFDTIGPIARTAIDCAALLEELGQPSLVERSVARFVARCGVRGQLTSLEGIRVGVVRQDHFVESSDTSVGPLFEDMVSTIRMRGARVIEVELPNFRIARLATLLLGQAEGFAYHRAKLKSRWDDYFTSTRERLALGALISGGDFVQAQRVRRATQTAVAEVFRHVDVIVTPTATMGAPAYGPDLQVEIAALVENVHTGYWSFVGLPTLAMPMGFTAAGSPASLQLAGRAFEDHLVLAVGALLQEMSDWHLRVPPDPGPPPEIARRGDEDVGQPNMADLQSVRTFLAPAGLRPTERELVAMANRLPSLRASIEMLYVADGTDPDVSPATVFCAELDSV
jgi:aspartyl-tRNA(Asn)/glutamyl-tRNA(Gln) amidotransferase subunit A